MKIKPPKVNIVLPVYNEEQALEKALTEVYSFCDHALAAYDWHLVIANNGSFDATGSKAIRMERTYNRISALHLGKAGRGGALLEAAKLSGADYLIYMDVDLSTHLEAIPRMLDALDRGADLVVGSRHHPASRVVRGTLRDTLSRSYNVLLRMVFKTKTFRDAQCGCKAFRLHGILPLIEKVHDKNWFFDTELLIMAEYGGFNVVELPVDWTEDPCSKVHVPRVIFQCLGGLIRLRFSIKRSYPL